MTSAKKPNKDGINLLVSILVCYPEIGNIIGSLKGSRMSDRMIGIREEGRVMVFNK